MMIAGCVLVGNVMYLKWFDPPAEGSVLQTFDTTALIIGSALLIIGAWRDMR